MGQQLGAFGSTFVMRSEIQIGVRSGVLRVDNPISCKPPHGPFLITTHNEAVHQVVYPLDRIFAVFLGYVENHPIEISIPASDEIPPYSDVL
ncbi:hypothetical protein CUPL110328_05030 [Cupriavidus plantarum]|nr:hypothetical protein LMG26296_03491 [Cupriavidus plantarum]